MLKLANHPDFSYHWHMDLLFFSSSWLKKRTDIAWKLFHHFLLETAWLDTSYLRDQVTFDCAFSIALLNRNLKPNPYLADTVKHLYLICRGVYPGFIVADDDRAGPISGLQEIFSNYYNLKYSPIMLHPWGLTHEVPQRPYYYSLAIPTLLEFSPKARKASSKFEDLREIKHIMKNVKQSFSSMLKNEWKIEDTPVHSWAEKSSYAYYHTDDDRYGENIYHTSTLVNFDPYLQTQLKKYPLKPFCDTSPFFRGCISILFEK